VDNQDHHQDAPRSATTRRQFVQRTAIGAAAAWVVPQIISAPAVSASTTSPTCVPTVVDWSDFASSVSALNSPGPGFFDVAIGNKSKIRVSYSIAGISVGGSATASYATTTPLGGETTNFLELSMQAGAVGDFQELTFDFIGAVGTAAHALTFNLLDVDLGTGFWQDQVRLSATMSGVPILASSVTTGPDNTATVVGNSDVVTGTNDPSGIGDGTDNSTTDANATVVYPTTINKLVLRYTALDNTALQQIGISSLSFCLFE
jgi:hypothetical protein